MLGYGLMCSRPRSATETTRWPLIALAAQQRHLSRHVRAAVASTAEGHEAYSG
jgi:hypothetical protein